MSKYSNLKHFIELAKEYNRLNFQDKDVLDSICDAGFPAIEDKLRRNKIVTFLENLDIMIAVPVEDAKNLMKPLLLESTLV